MKTQAIKDKQKIKLLSEIPLAQGKVKDYLLIKLLLNTGLRISDALKLKWSDIPEDFKYRVKIKEGKTGKPKELLLNGEVQKALEKAREKYPNDTYIFEARMNGGENRGYWSRTRAYQIIRKWAKKAGFEKSVSPHSLRKTFGYWNYKDGKSIQLLQKIFNHSTPKMTLEYIGITQEDIDKVYMTTNL